MFQSEQEPGFSLSPSSKHTRFVFDSHVHEAHHDRVQQQLNIVEDRIRTLVGEATVSGLPLAEYILKTVPNPDPNELEFLGEALVRIAKLLPVYNKLKSLLGFIVYARENPNEAMLAFADTSGVIDDITTFLSKEHEG